MTIHLSHISLSFSPSTHALMMGGTNMNDTKPSAKAAHVNMMTDTIIANLPIEGLRSIMRGMLGGDPKITSNFHNLTSAYLEQTRPPKIPFMFTKVPGPTPQLARIQSRYRCLMGCGYPFESMKLLLEVLRQIQVLEWDEKTSEGESFVDVLAVLDGDIVQAVTAVQKSLLTSSGMKPMEPADSEIVAELKRILSTCQADSSFRGQSFAFERGLSCLDKLIGGTSKKTTEASPAVSGFVSSDSSLESFKLGAFEVPRIFMGLWQFSSPSWGTASRSKINRDFRKHVDAGLIAYDMADHYGDAEVTFGQFRSSQPDSSKIYCATKWAVFEPIQVSQETVDANISERLEAINSTSVDLLQFHWQNYDDHQYVEASRLIEQHPQVQNLGLCNFDTLRMEELLENGVKFVSNQVQFSLIDLRPTFKMAECCSKHGIKLLAYGSLCGGFLADKWLGQPSPNLFDSQMTPSHRKYLEMITIWGGWALFQELLTVLAEIGKKYNVSISNVAVRWVLDHDYVGAVIVGARMGISEHIEENLKSFSFELDSEDKGKVDQILSKCNSRAIFQEMGDCGSEYRQ